MFKKFFQGIVPNFFAHEFSKEMAQKSVVVSKNSKLVEK